MTDVTGAAPALWGDSRAEPERDEATSSSINLVEIGAAVYRSRWPIGIIFLASFLLATLYSLLTTPYYKSEATVEIKQEAEKVLGTEADRESSSSKLDADRFLATQLDIIRSRATANAVAESLGLFRDKAFLEAMRARAADESSGVLTEKEAKREVVIRTLQRNLAVALSGDTRLAVLQFSAPDPRLAAQVANSYAENFIRGNLARKLDSSSYALDFLRTQLSEAQARLERSEQDAVNYARLKRIVDASNAASEGKAGQPQSLITAQLVQLNSSLAQATAERIGAEQKWSQTVALPLMNIPEVLTNQAIQGMLQKRTEAESAYREQLSTRRDAYPSVEAARNSLASIDAQIGSLSRSIRGSIKNQFDVAKAREQQIQRALDALKGDTLSEQNESIQLSILHREAETNRAQYEALLKRFNELNAESGVQTNNLAVVDRAQVPTRTSWPNLPLNFALAAVFAFLASSLLIIARAQLFDAIRTPNDVADRLGLPLLGSVPQDIDLLNNLRDSKSIVSEAFSSIRTSLSLTSEHGAPRSIMITSAQQGEGKSSTCHALALSFARLGKQVIIVDVDLRRPNAHRLFELENKVGLSNYLSGQVSLDQVVLPTSVANVSIITAGAIPPNPTEQLSGQTFAPLIAFLIDKFDFVLLDAAPVLGLADALVVGNHVEATLFVVEAGRNTVKGARSALDRLNQGRTNISGAVLTKFDASRMGYGYSDYSGYHYNYGGAEQS